MDCRFVVVVESYRAMHCCQLQAVVVGGRLWTVVQSQVCDQIGFAVGPGDYRF